MVKIFTENNLEAIMERYKDNVTDNWKKITTILTDIWFVCPNLEVGERLSKEMLEGGSVYFYHYNFPNDNLADMTLGKFLLLIFVLSLVKSLEFLINMSELCTKVYGTDPKQAFRLWRVYEAKLVKSL